MFQSTPERRQTVRNFRITDFIIIRISQLSRGGEKIFLPFFFGAMLALHAELVQEGVFQVITFTTAYPAIALENVIFLALLAYRQ